MRETFKVVFKSHEQFCSCVYSRLQKNIEFLISISLLWITQLLCIEDIFGLHLFSQVSLGFSTFFCSFHNVSCIDHFFIAFILEHDLIDLFKVVAQV